MSSAHVPLHARFFAALAEQTQRRRIRHAREALALLALGVVFLLVHPFVPDARILALAAITILPAIAVWIFVAFAGRWSPSITRLRARAGAVVWVFAELGERDVREASLVFALDDGTSVSLPIEPEAEGALLSEASLVFASASIGFSRELREAFHRDPRSLRVPPRREAVDVAPHPSTSHAWLVGPAHAVMRASRLLGGLGVVLALLGAGGLVIVTQAAPPGDERTVLAATFAVVMLSGLALAAYGLRRFESTALYRALRTSEGLSSVKLLEGHGPTGDVVPMAMVTLKSGARYTFIVPRRGEP